MMKTKIVVGMIVESITQTCGACPSQWEGKLTDGRMFYARYIWGGLNVEVSKGPTDNVYDAMEELVISEKLGDDFDGVMGQEELIGVMKANGFTFN